MDEWMDELTKNEWMNEWTNERTNALETLMIAINDFQDCNKIRIYKFCTLQTLVN